MQPAARESVHEPFPQALAAARQGRAVSHPAHNNYADDLVILSAGRAAEALEWTTKVTAGLKLNLNPSSGVKDGGRERFDFLGYSFGPERLRLPRSGWYLAACPSETQPCATAGQRGGSAMPDQRGAVGGNRDAAQSQATRLGQLLQLWHHLAELLGGGLVRL